MLIEEINGLKKEVVVYAQFVETMLERSIEALMKRDGVKFQAVIDQDESRANAFELQLDESCAGVIAQFQPKAKNLRTILMILKMSNDLERMADHAVNISYAGLNVVSKPAVTPLIDTPKMAELVIQMMKDSISSIINEDVDLAKDVCHRDDMADALRKKIVTDLIAVMHQSPDAIDGAFSLIKIADNLERIADLSTNLCEDVIFISEGRVVRHQNP